MRPTMAFLALVVLLVSGGAAQAQSDFDDCGILEQGVTCVLFLAQGGGAYILEDYGTFEVGDEVFVTGSFDPLCITICQQGDGCILNNTIEPASCGPPVPFIRGDVDGNALVNGIVDGVYLLTWGFNNGAPPPCDDAADVDDDGTLNPLVDTIYLLNFFFIFPSPEPPPPYPDCGSDPTDDALFCDIIPPCP